MKKYLFLIVIFLMIINLNFISSVCKDNQIDINSASLKELEDLSGIGPVKAQSIVDSRPFEKIDDLIKVKGIGEVTLNKIKEQDLACVGNKNTKNKEEIYDDFEDEEIESKESKKSKEESQEIELVSYKLSEEDENKLNNKESKKLEPIVLNEVSPKNIKSEENTKELNKTKLANYGLIIICILVGFLFLLKKKENEKSEFR